MNPLEQAIANIREEYGIEIDFSKINLEKYSYQAPEFLVPVLLKEGIKQNPGKAEEARTQLEKFLKTDAPKIISERLSMDVPAIRGLNLIEGHELCSLFYYQQKDRKIYAGQSAVLRLSKDPQKALDIMVHEYAHFLSHHYNILMPKGKRVNTTFSQTYHRGNFLDSMNHAQLEGFAEWLAKSSNKNVPAYNDVEKSVKEAKTEQEKTRILRRFYDNQYSFGRAVFDLLEQADGIEAVKKLGLFEGIKTRKELLGVYKDACKKLGMPAFEIPERKKNLLEVYQDITKENRLKKYSKVVPVLEQCNKRINAMLACGIEPRILQFYPSGYSIENEITADVLSDSYWHYGIIAFDAAYLNSNEERFNYEGGDVTTLWDQVNSKHWNLCLLPDAKSIEWCKDKIFTKEVKRKVKLIEY